MADDFCHTRRRRGEADRKPAHERRTRIASLATHPSKDDLIQGLGFPPESAQTMNAWASPSTTGGRGSDRCRPAALASAARAAAAGRRALDRPCLEGRHARRAQGRALGEGVRVYCACSPPSPTRVFTKGGAGLALLRISRSSRSFRFLFSNSRRRARSSLVRPERRLASTSSWRSQLRSV